MRKVLMILMAIQRAAKGIHYHTGGAQFFSDHLLADRIYEDLDDLIDEIQENYFLGKEEDAPAQKDLLKGAAELVPDETEDMKLAFTALDQLLLDGINTLQTTSELSALTAGDNDLIGRICSDLQKKHGFVWRRLK